MVAKDKNKKRYNELWKRTDVQRPEIWSTWQVVKGIIGEKNLEVGPGNYPKIPIQDGYFLDISETAVSNLKKASAKAFLGSIEKINFPDNFFDSIIAMDILEHVDDDKGAVSEITRVLKKGGYFLFSVPLRKEEFGELDRIARHKRRYEISELITLTSKYRLELVKWRSPSLEYSWIVHWARLPFFREIFFKVYGSKKLPRFFDLPRLLVNFLVRLSALIDKISSPAWQENVKTLENFKGSWVMLLCQKKEEKVEDFGGVD